MRLRLYPYLVRINTSKKEHHEMLIEKMKSIRYFRFIRESATEDERIIVGWIECPLIVYEQLIEYLEKLKRNKSVNDYFMKQIRHKKLTWTITTDKLEPTTETYKKLLHEPETCNYYTITAMDEKHEIYTMLKEKEEVFNENVLMFISSLMNHHLGKSNIAFRPIELIYELCEKNGVDSKNSSEVLAFVNQMEIRCRRLKIFDYYLYFREFFLFKKALYIEIIVESDEPIVKNILRKFEVTAEMIRLLFLDRIVLILPEVKIENKLREILEKLLEENGVKFTILQLNYHRGLKIPKLLFNEAFDINNDQWKND